MRKVLVLVTAVVLTAYFSAPVMAGDQGATPSVGQGGEQLLIAAKGKRRRVVRVKKPGLEDTVRRIVEDTLRDKPKEWQYSAKRMRPPKGSKWQGRWNDLGAKGWEFVGQNENVYIFKRPAMMASMDTPKAGKKAGGRKEYKQSHTKPAKDESVAPATQGSNKGGGRQ